MNTSTIVLNDKKAERLGLTSDKFEDAFAWDCRPHYIGIVRIKPRNTDALIDFFNKASEIYSTVVITAPSEDVITMAKSFNYELKTDPAGIPYLTDEVSKTRSRQHK